MLFFREFTVFNIINVTCKCILDDLRKIYQEVKAKDNLWALNTIFKLTTHAAHDGKRDIKIKPSEVLNGYGYGPEGLLTPSFIRMLVDYGFCVKDITSTKIGICYQISGWDKAAENTAILETIQNYND